jgi:hypothetical membrane protein
MTNATSTTSPASVSLPTTTTRWLLAGAAVGAPLFAVAVLAQALTRQGFDLTRHPASQLSNGDLGWIQITTFLLTGALTLGGAVGVRRVLRGGRAGIWGPLLLAVQGAALMAAGVFRLDPADGFPPGTPDGIPTSMSWHSVLHNICGSLAFLSMIAACFVLARWFATTGQRAWAIYGRISGVVFIVGLVWALTGGPAGALTLFVGVVTAWTWISASAARLARLPAPASR